jgi:hypothetical protein
MQIFENRVDMIQTLLKEGMVGCEIGVFAGEFAEQLYARKPAELYLIDAWEGEPESRMLFSGDQDGNNGTSYPDFYLYAKVVNQFSDCPNVKILKGWTTDVLPTLPDNYFDYIYMDADHSYEGMKRDLKLILPKVKPNALILGHDYEMNFAKATIPWKFGVKQAVDEFCKEFDYKLVAKGMDGCVSFCLIPSK